MCLQDIKSDKSLPPRHKSGIGLTTRKYLWQYRLIYRLGCRCNILFCSCNFTFTYFNQAFNLRQTISIQCNAVAVLEIFCFCFRKDSFIDFLFGFDMNTDEGVKHRVGPDFRLIRISGQIYQCCLI